MVIPYACVFIAAVLPLLFAAYAKFSSRGYDNSAPREFLDKLHGKSKRAHYAQLNSFEAFGPFAAGVIIARLASVTPLYISICAVTFVIFRALYGLCYIADKSTLRSTMWFGGFFCVVTLYISAMVKASVMCHT